MADKKCPICGSVFQAPPSSKKITCSPKCSAERKRISHIGKHNVWSDEKKDALKAKGYPSAFRFGTKAAQKSPVAGPFETNQNAKHWVLKSPKGVLYEFDNLTLFVRKHPEFFPNPKSARSALAASAACLAGKPYPSRKYRQFSQYKGWQVVWYGKRISSNPKE